MKSKHETGEIEAISDPPPFLYEIRVKGRLSGEQWTSWFDDLTVTFVQGDSTLRGVAPDHAALYGLLARLRDLAIPLVAVRVLDAEAQHKLAQTSRRYDLLINGLLVALYLLLLGGLATITVFVAPVINVALSPDAAVRAARCAGPCLLALERPAGMAVGQLCALARRRHHFSGLHPRFRPDASGVGHRHYAAPAGERSALRDLLPAPSRRRHQERSGWGRLSLGLAAPSHRRGRADG